MTCNDCPMKDRIKRLEQIVTDAGLYVPGWAEVEEAIRQGNFEPYLKYKAAGGKIPEYEPETKGGGRQRRSSGTLDKERKGKNKKV